MAKQEEDFTELIAARNKFQAARLKHDQARAAMKTAAQVENAADNACATAYEELAETLKKYGLRR